MLRCVSLCDGLRFGVAEDGLEELVGRYRGFVFFCFSLGYGFGDGLVHLEGLVCFGGFTGESVFAGDEFL